MRTKDRKGDGTSAVARTGVGRRAAAVAPMPACAASGAALLRKPHHLVNPFGVSLAALGDKASRLRDEPA